MRNSVIYIIITCIVSSCEKPAPQKPKVIYTGKEEIKQKFDSTTTPIPMDSIEIDSIDVTVNNN